MKYEKKLFIFIILLAFIELAIVSKNSFLYCFNDWVDVDSFVTVGKGWIEGLIPYKDLFEQKGPLLYLIYAIGMIISKKSFIGIYFLEVVSYSIFLYYIYKIIKKYIDNNYSIVILMLFSSIILSSPTFYFGGSAEEFTLPMLGYLLYKFIDFLDSKNITKKDLFISGLMTGLIFNIKFNLIGFSFIFMASIDLYYLYKKEIKKCINYSLIFLSGMFIPILIFILYFLLNNSLYEYIEAYFLYNACVYGYNVSLYRRMYVTLKAFKCALFINYYILIPYIISVFTVIFSKKIFKDTYSKISIIAFILMGAFGIYFNTRYYVYYFLPVAIFCIFGLIYIFKLIKFKKSIIFITVIISSLLLLTSSNISSIGRDIKTTIQYKYAKIINEVENAKVINYDSQDNGFYFMADVSPANRYFHKLNGMKEEMTKKVEEGISNMEYDFIIYKTKEYPCDKVINNYTIIEDDSEFIENHTYYYYLFKKNT